MEVTEINGLEISNSVFEKIKHIGKEGNEYWTVRELMPLLEYNKWQNFEIIIKKAKIACDKSNNILKKHFTDVGKMVSIGSKTKRKITDCKLSRYACYLIVQNGDSRKKVITLTQTYFAVQTRKV